MISLTQQEVDALPDGVEVEIIWSGGNGPHRYITWRDRSARYLPDSPQARTEQEVRLDIKPYNRYIEGFVGPDKPFTTVRLLSPWFQGY